MQNEPIPPDLIQLDITTKIYERIQEHRNNFHDIMCNRYLEFLPLTISYEHTDDHLINKVRLENILRCGYGAVIGELTTGKIGLLGYITTQKKNPLSTFVNLEKYNQNDIDFILSPALRLSKYEELSDIDNYENGNFIVIWNKPLNYNNDYAIVKHYVDELTEIIVSRFSIIMQAKINTFLRDEFGSEDMSEIASDLYNGKPWIKTTSKFDPEEHIISISNTAFVSALTELKRTYQNIISELNSMLGLNSLGVDKESGVSQTEANSNRSFKKANENIYLRSRNEQLEKLNAKYGTHFHAEYVDSMVQELSSLEKLEVIENG